MDLYINWSDVFFYTEAVRGSSPLKSTINTESLNDGKCQRGRNTINTALWSRYLAAMVTAF
jgi:hypothetical protein